MRKIRDVLRCLHELKQSFRQTALTCGISRPAVEDYDIRARSVGLSWPIPDDLDDFALEAKLFPPSVDGHRRRHPQPDWAKVHIEAKSKGGTLLQLHREYREQYPDGMSYAQFCAQHQEYAKGLKRYLRKSYQAGECVFVDFAGKTMNIHEMGGAEVVRRPVQIFVAALGASHLVYAEAIPSQQIPDWLAAHNRMWAFYGGVTRIIVPDNLKAAVILADRHNPEIHPTYRDHARHYGTQVVPARPRTPKDKGKVEQAVQLVQRWILFRLRKRIFTSLGELNSAIAHLLTELNDAKMRRLGKSRREIFEQIERPALQPLPTTPYEYAEYVKLRVNLDNHVHIDGRDYSVPYQLVRTEVEARIKADTIEIFRKGRRIGLHPRDRTPGRSTKDEHRDPAHLAYLNWSKGADLEWASKAGPGIRALVEGAFSLDTHRDHQRRLVPALRRLATLYGADRLDQACATAVRSALFESSVVRNLLRNRREAMPPPDSDQQTAVNPAVQDHSNLRGDEYFNQLLKTK